MGGRKCPHCLPQNNVFLMNGQKWSRHMKRFHPEFWSKTIKERNLPHENYGESIDFGGECKICKKFTNSIACGICVCELEKAKNPPYLASEKYWVCSACFLKKQTFECACSYSCIENN